MTHFHDPYLGDISVRRLKQARHISFRIAPSGTLVVSAPASMPMLMLKHAIRGARRDMEESLHRHQQRSMYHNGQEIGKSHVLSIVTSGTVVSPQTTTKDRSIAITLPPDCPPDSNEAQSRIRHEVLRALRRESKAYLPRRLHVLATRHDYSYRSVRFSHASSRWGSCSSSGTISLNIALMKLPLELIDYVLLHELCHTKEMNHSEQFWEFVAEVDPNYRHHRKVLKTYTPSV
jgi:predicted metal-dependent hydrolase